jgi:hypothetical protein
MFGELKRLEGIEQQQKIAEMKKAGFMTETKTPPVQSASQIKSANDWGDFSEETPTEDTSNQDKDQRVNEIMDAAVHTSVEHMIEKGEMKASENIDNG